MVIQYRKRLKAKPLRRNHKHHRHLNRISMEYSKPAWKGNITGFQKMDTFSYSRFINFVHVHRLLCTFLFCNILYIARNYMNLWYGNFPFYGKDLRQIIENVARCKHCWCYTLKDAGTINDVVRARPQNDKICVYAIVMYNTWKYRNWCELPLLKILFRQKCDFLIPSYSVNVKINFCVEMLPHNHNFCFRSFILFNQSVRIDLWSFSLSCWNNL